MAREEYVLVSYHEFLEQLGDAETARDFLFQLLDSHYSLGPIRNRSDIEALPNGMATELGRTHFPLFYLIQSQPDSQKKS